VKKRSVGDPRVKWWTLTRENTTKLVEKIKIDGCWKLIEDVDAIWEVWLSVFTGLLRRS